MSGTGLFPGATGLALALLALLRGRALKDPRTRMCLAVGLMGGAIMSHLTRLGIEVQGDHGLLFKLALTVLVAALVVLFIRRRELPIIGDRF